MEQKRTKKAKNDLIGKFIHMVEDGKIECQGEVIASPEPGYYLIQLYSWITGFPTNEKLVHVSDMKNWKFYSDIDDWKEATRK